MIDTIILTTSCRRITCFTDDRIPKWELHSKSGVFEKYVKNQTARQKADGIYRPRIRDIKRGRESLLQIEFSIPKLIYGNNIDEVCENDFENVIETLRIRLLDFGVAISNQDLKLAGVSALHLSKNIILSDGYTASGIIKELNKINLSKRMDLNKDSFRNEGQSLQYYTNSHSLVIYDKIQDLKKPKNRAIDKDKTHIQLSLFNYLNERKVEILRFEVRLSKKVKMNAIIQKVGYGKNPKFQDVFKKEICQKIVKLYWEEIIIDKNLFLFSLMSNPSQLLKKVTKNYPSIKPREAIYLVGLQQLSKDEAGIRNLRLLLQKQGSERTWYRITDDMKKLNSMQPMAECHSWVRQTSEQIEQFKPYVSNFCNVKNCKV